MMFGRCFALMLLLPMTVAAQRETTIQIASGPSIGQPVVLSGSARSTYDSGKPFPYTFKTTLSAVNVSDKDILLVIMTTNLTGTGKYDIHDTRVDDYFFTPNVFGRNETKTIDNLVGPLSEPEGPVELEPLEPRAVADVRFVQFFDGSTWGDSASGAGALQDRRSTWNRLKLLIDKYRTGGEQDFVLALRQPSQSQPIRMLQQLYESSGQNADVVVKKAHAMIDCAEAHQRGLEPHAR